VWLNRVKSVYGTSLDVTWKNFCLEQINSADSPDCKVWEQPDPTQRRSLIAAMSGEAAKKQGSDHFEKFHLALLTARHGGDGRIALNEIKPMIDLAEEVGLDTTKFKRDIMNPQSLEIIGDDHKDAVENHGVFGTPTFLFKNGHSAYLKTFIPPEKDSIEAFKHFMAISADRPYIGELKRPQPPWPKGALL